MEALLVIGLCVVAGFAALNVICGLLGLFPFRWSNRLAEKFKRGGE